VRIWRNRSEGKRRLVEAIVGIVMLPLSAIPVFLYLDKTPDGYLMYLRGRYALFAPATPSIDASTKLAAFSLAEQRFAGVPVLVYHGIGRTAVRESATKEDSRLTVSRGNFAEQMRALQSAGYQAITSAQLAAYLKSGDTAALPPHPVLITFDDGRTDAMLQADPILRATGMKATMFVIGAAAKSNSFYYEQWPALRSFANNGRWDLQAHTYDLHHIHDNVKGVLPISAVVDLAKGETLAWYSATLRADFGQEDNALRAVGAHPVAFAYPFDDWGQNARPGVAARLHSALAARYELAFDQSGQSGWRFALPGDDAMHIHRLEVQNWTGAQFSARLAAAGKLTQVVYAERGLGYHYSPRALADAAARQSSSLTISSKPLRSVDVGRQKLVALTFDGGPSPYTAQVLDQLKLARAHATFFPTGDLLAGHAPLLQRMMVEGNQVGGGSWDTSRSGSLAEQLARTSVAIQNALPLRPQIARPAHGEDVTAFRHAAAEHGMATVLWSIDPGDRKPDATPQRIAVHVLAQLKPGAIVILNDGGDTTRWKTVQALPLILKGLTARGYEAVTVSELAASQRVAKRHPVSRNHTPIRLRGPH
jgi:peptidoglycan/xylan/chitin deacetylase (PgdA/CDA1 family)